MSTPLQEAMFAALAGHAGVSARVGTRVYPDLAPHGTARPYVVWEEVSFTPTADLDGSEEGAGGLHNYRVQVTSWAERSASLARDLDREVRKAMQAATGFASIQVDARTLGFEPETKLIGIQSDFSVWLKITA